MKKFYFTAVLVIFWFLGFSQTAETEPNNTFNTANEFILGEETTGSVNAADTVDFHKLDFAFDAGLYMIVEVTNNGSALSLLSFDLYNTLQINGEYLGNFYGTGYSLTPGSTLNDTIRVCGKAADSFYVKLKSSGTFNYKITWYPLSANFSGTFNNTIATATPFSFNVLTEQGIGHEFWGDIYYDTVDYFISTLPAANYDSVFLKINAQNTSCQPNKWLKYFCYKNGSTIPFAMGFVGNDSAVNAYFNVNTILPLNNMQAGDNLLIKYVSNAAFSYKFKYSQPDEFEPDDETGDFYLNAPTISENETFTGNVGEYDSNVDEYVDEADYYKIVLPNDGAFKLLVKARNDECDVEVYNLSVDVLDENGNTLTGDGLVSWENFPTCGTILFDTSKLRAFVGGTFYLRLNTSGSYGKVSYNIRYQIADSTASDSLETYGGNGSTDLETIAAGQTKKGHIRFRKNAYQFDPQDLYQTTLPVGGSVRVFLKATFRGDYEEFNSANADKFSFSGFGISRRLPANPPVSFISPDAVYRDTFVVCGLNAGVSNFLLSSALPYEYEVRYEMVDTADTDDDIEPNNSFAQATLVPSTLVNKGHINYYGGAFAVDTYDYYKVIVGTSDSVKIFMQGTNKSCENNKNVRIRGYNKNQVSIFNRVFALNNNVLANQTVIDSFKIFVNAPDTIYLRFEATAPFNYQFYTKTFKPTSLFKIEGDSTVCLGTQTYIAKNSVLPGDTVTYNWSLPLGGGTLSFVDSIATVVWNSTGNRSVQLSLSNAAGSSAIKTLTVVVNSSQPTQVPIAFNFARTLSTQNIPAGANAQWYNNNVLIAGASESSYYAALAGTYTVKFVNDCGDGTASNAISFPANAITQTITFPHVPQQTMSPTLKVKLNATASSGLPVFYQKISGSGTILNDSVSITGVGTFIVRALQPGDNVYREATAINDTITVVKGNQTILFDSVFNQIFSSTPVQLNAVSSQQQFINYNIVSGNGIIQGNANRINLTGAGIITVQARQNGNANYNAAAPVQRSFCVGVRTITPITGDPNPCLATYKYATQKIPGALYSWTLSGGGILTQNNDTAIVQWQTPGSYTLKVKATTVCDPIFTNEVQYLITTSNNSPSVVTNMLPANNAINQQLPLQLSWIPGANTVNYDLFVWDAILTQPVTPYAANINGINFTLPLNSFAFNKTYKWRVVSKNPCTQTPGPVQQFSLIPLPDLLVSNVLTPSSANSGQTITISWRVTNVGPGNTTTNQSWKDAVFLSFDTLPNFTLPPNVGGNWFAADFPVRTKLLASVPNLTALNNGQNYINSITYTLPINFSVPIYAYVITNYAPTASAPLQVTRLNDTARAAQPILITLSPTPDLRVDTVFAPFTTFSGSTINLAYRVKNYGVLTPAGATWRDSIFISQNPLFDRSTAIPLKLPKPNGSFYPNAADAGIGNNTQILADSFFTKNVQVLIPNFIFGTWFIYIKANANTTLYEGALNNNNVNKTQIQLYLTPTPKLTITNLNIPVTTASTTQPLGITWNIFNDGLTDNIQKNKGHYFNRFIGYCPCFCSGCGPGQVCIGPPAYYDSIGLGSSFWIDRVYLSADSSGFQIGNSVLLQTINHGVENSGFFVFEDNFPTFVGGLRSSCGFIGPTNVSNVINPRSTFPTSAGFSIPANLQPGNYYIYVVANPTKTVFEYPGTLQVKRSTLPITVQRPDVVVSSISVPPAVNAGQPILLNYTVLNSGLGAVFNSVRRDRIYVSNFPNFDASAQLLGTQTFTENIPVNTPVGHTYNYTFTPATTGAKYFYVHTNFDSSFRETNATNNFSAAAGTTVTAAAAADLVVSNIQMADTVFSLFSSRIIYTVTNNGPGITSGTWVDSIYISCSPSFNTSNNKFVARKTQLRTIAAGGIYTDTISFTLPQMSYQINNCFPVSGTHTAYFFVKTNATGSLYEGAGTSNNSLGSGTRVLVNPLVDHIVTEVSGADSGIVARGYRVDWVVKNIGYRPSSAYYNGWNDGAFFSSDSVFSNTAVFAGELSQRDLIPRNLTLSSNRLFTVPNIPSGDYYVFIKTNHRNGIIGELAINNNTNLIREPNGTAKKIYITQLPLPDFTDSVISATTTVAVGQSIKFRNRMTNIGAGVNFPNNYTNKLWLSTDFVTTDTLGDKLLSARGFSRTINPGQSFEDSIQVFIPLNTVPGNYILKSKVNGTGTVFETNDQNNFSFAQLNIFIPPAADLVIDSINKPDTVYLGYKVDSIKWKIKNIAANGAYGMSTSGVYLSKSIALDSAAVLIGLKTKNISIDPLSAIRDTLTPIVNNLTEGSYNMLIKTDLLNNIVENDKDNNVTVAATPIYVGVQELPLNVLTLNTLQRNARYYKLIVPDSLLGSTIKITLKTNDSSLVRNEMYVGGNFIPSSANFDYRFEIPNYGNQQIVIADVVDTLYYIVYNCVSPNPPTQNVTLKAEKLPFSILNVNTPSGGNIGNVTIKISGSLFRDSMMAKLSNAGTTINASAVYFTNSTIVYATFNLAGKPLGLYDVTLTKPDNTIAVMPNGFSIVPANNGGLITGSGVNSVPGNGNAPGCDPGAASGLNSQLVVEIVVPEFVVVNWPFTIQLNYSNPTNGDITAQTRILYSELGVKMALSPGGVSSGSTSLYLELSEPGGPPGIIRAGGSGTITIYSKSPTSLTNGFRRQSALFKLK